MPADKSKPAAAKPAAAKPADVPATDTAPADAAVSAATDATDATATDGDGTEAAPLNRAERRAQKKAGGKPQVVAKMQPKGVNSGPAPRQWANRRSG